LATNFGLGRPPSGHIFIKLKLYDKIYDMVYDMIYGMICYMIYNIIHYSIISYIILYNTIGAGMIYDIFNFNWFETRWQ
jgi:hypothetical protein